MIILGTVTLHNRQFRIVDNARMKTKRLCLEVCQDQFWHRVCRFDKMDEVLWWLRLYELNRVSLEDYKEYERSLKDRGKPLEEKI